VFVKECATIKETSKVLPFVRIANFTDLQNNPSMKRILSIFLLLLSSIAFGQSQKDLTLQEIWASRQFAPQFVMGMESMNDGQHYSALRFEEDVIFIEKFSYAKGEKVAVIYDGSKFKLPDGSPISFDEYVFSADETKLLVPIEAEPIYRHSFKSDFIVIDLVTGKAEFLSRTAGKQQYAEFSPDGKKVAFVRDNNLFIKDLASGNELTITNDGKQNSIINGATDWVYEEEFALAQAFFWSPDGNKVAFLRFDESEVKEFNMAMYGSLYPSEYKYKYPKAGEKNSSVAVMVYDLAIKTTTKMNCGDSPEQYIPRVKWTSNSKELCITRMNRLQNHLELLLASPVSGEVKLLLEEKNSTYIDIHDNLIFLEDGKRFIWSSELGGRNHLYLYGMDGKRLNAITSGEMDVTEVFGLDEKNSTIWFQAAAPTPSDRTIFSVKLNGKGQKNLLPMGGHQNAEFSNTFSFFILQQSNANEPTSFALYNNKGVQVRMLENNQGLKDKLKEYRLTSKTFLKIPNGQGTDLEAWVIRPPDFDPSKKYPVFMTVYGGPGHNTVENQWEGSNYLWYQMLAQKGYIVVSVDNRGTQFRGEEFKKSTYKQLGKLETEDQIAAAKYMAAQPYVDPSRIGIQGWSYGGYMSSLCITKGADVFKMAIAVAPVTNWRYYDSIYTERFMQTPQENGSGYDDNSPINHVSRLKGKYLLIHGTADDNVHFQNSVEMVTALVKANKQFDLFFYPDKNHGIYGGNTRLHLYNMMTNFIIENL
jgi:dipeptidyl-peptidase-4